MTETYDENDKESTGLVQVICLNTVLTMPEANITNFGVFHN